MAKKTDIKTAPAYRTATLSRAGESDEYALSFSSEAPVRRSFFIEGDYREGDEVLSHRADDVDLSWFASGRAPLLLDHNLRTQIGVISRARIEGDRLVGSVRFSKSAQAQEIRQDVDDGIRGNVSIGYEIREIDWDRDAETFRVTSWGPFEGSLVSVPADTTVGAGRSNPEPTIRTVVRSAPSMTEKKTPETPASDTPNPPVTQLSEDEAAKMRAEAAERETKRIEGIQAYARQFQVPEMADKAVRDGTSLELFRGQLLEHLPAQTPLSASSDLGLSKQDRQKYSLVKAIRCLGSKDAADIRKAEKEAAFEIEVSRAYAEKVGKEPRGIYVPIEAIGTRLLDTGAGSGGDHLVGTETLASEFIESLENMSAILALGGRSMMGLEGNVLIPRRTAGSTASWVATEDAEAAESDSTFDEVSLTPKDLAYYTSFTRRLMLQSSPDIEALVRSDVFRAIGNGIDAAAINGGGASGVPQGIRTATGVGTQSLATLNYANILSMEEDVLAANAGGLGGMAFLSSARGLRRFSETTKDAGSGMFLLDRRSSAANGVVKGEAIGYPFGVSQNVPDNLGGGTDLSAVIFGAFSQIMIGMWGGLDIVVDPYTESRRGRMRVTVFQTADVAVRHPEAFSVASDLAA